jgi:hypothetical protein
VRSAHAWSAALRRSPHNRFNPIRILLNNLRWSLMDYKFKGEAGWLVAAGALACCGAGVELSLAQAGAGGYTGCHSGSFCLASRQQWSWPSGGQQPAWQLLRSAGMFAEACPAPWPARRGFLDD